jgi:energy-coupling factor transporter ATP-binding protein EcfA2
MTADPRLKAFLHCPLDVFESIEHRHEIWREDPFDVPAVHATARDEFERLLARVTTPVSPGAVGAAAYGRILLLLGDSGAGKTHLLRALRAIVHKSRAGFVGYMPLTSSSSDYRRYLLSNLIDSLDQPYDDPIDLRTGLARLAQALASLAFEPGIASFLRDDPDMEDDDVSDVVHSGADRVLRRPGFERIDVDLIAALLYLHRPDTRLKARVIKYLRCEELTERDRKLLGGLASKSRVEDAERMVEMLGRVMGAASKTPMSLVVCLDQLEGVFDKDTPVGPVLRALTAVSDLAELVPSSIFVVSSLKDFYESARRDLPRSLLERIQKQPPIMLQEARTRDEAREMIKTRLQHLYAFAGADFDPLSPLYPFPPQFIEHQQLSRTREIIDACHRYREKCQRAGVLLPFDGDELPTNPPDPQRIALIGEWERRWNDFFSEKQSAPPEEEDGLAEILAWALDAAGRELETGHRFPTRLLTGAVHVEATWEGRTWEHLYVALCNRTEKFGWLGKQILQHAQQAQGDARRPALVLARNDAMPTSPSVAKALKSALGSGGRTVVLQDSDWRTMCTLRRFCEEHREADGFADWLADENHLSRLPSIRNILELDRLDRFGPVAPARTTVPPAARAVKSQEATNGSPSSPPVPGRLVAGSSKSLLSRSVEIQVADLTRHAAFLGMTGSGKTTLALGLIEQLLLQGVPVLMVDRKGDLAGYARPETWSRSIADPVLAARQKQLAEKVDVALFTPGHPEGRPMAIGVAPDGLAEMSAFERDEAAALAAQAIADMLGYKSAGRDLSLRAILAQALKLLAEALDRPITLDELVKVVGDVDPLLAARVGRIDTKLFGQLAQSLETLKLTSTHLFGADAERLDIDALLGRGSHARPGRTRLCIVSTKFLNGDAQTQFWVAQLLMAILRWANKNPRGELQAALLFDEADLYLPALKQPATKAPMESLLKRGRSAGLSVQLATQSPGDLDYRCRDNIRTWFIGRVKEPRALEKLRPLLSAGSSDVTDRLATQGAGEFHMVQEGPPTPFSAAYSVLRTDQLPDNELLALARRGRPGGGAGAG